MDYFSIPVSRTISVEFRDCFIPEAPAALNHAALRALIDLIEAALTRRCRILDPWGDPF